ncbi:TRAP transporter small permease [Achromobacter pulmonis]|uniref:TRAP transporter small permease protein n=1 Tax=Achromobacter pulmonis TaxID=1389932 RepID=A0A2N8KIK8_9BURK|nr:TRAP transporter small permease [Achromobacter pulmonis]MBO9329618.1 TRAP transporter small permease subunit [Achromobacter xylosoxidans]PND33298.1 TRAP transporter small permease [Achromobacter pulmonis]
MNTDRHGWIGTVIDGICRVILWLSTTVIFVILVVNTALRYATGTSLEWANEVPELLFPWLVMSGVVLAALHNAHIATVFLMDALPAHVRRLVATVAWSVVAALYATLSWATLNMIDIVHDEKSPVLQMPGSLTYGCVMGGLVLLAVLAAQSAWQSWHSRDAVAQPDGEQQAPAVHW